MVRVLIKIKTKYMYNLYLGTYPDPKVGQPLFPWEGGQGGVQGQVVAVAIGEEVVEQHRHAYITIVLYCESNNKIDALRLTFLGRDLEALAAVALGEGGLPAGLFVGHVCKVQQ